MKKKVKVGVVRGATLEEVKSKKFNIYLGISLGNNWFTKDNIREHLKWALKYSKHRVGFLVADTLHAINYEVRNRMNPKKARKISLRKGDEVIKIFNELISELPKTQQGRIDIIRWDDIKKDLIYKDLIPLAEEAFRKNKKFRDFILGMVKKHLTSDERNFNQQEIERLGEYIIEELPEIINGFTLNGEFYGCYLYPQDSDLTILIEDLQRGRVFPDVGKKLVKKICAFVELIV